MPRKPTSRLQARLSLLQRTIETSRKDWWTAVCSVRNQEPTRDRKRTAAETFLHVLEWKIAHVAQRTRLLVRFGCAPYDLTLEDHVMALQGARVGTENAVNRLYNALRRTDWMLNRKQAWVKEAEIKYRAQLQELGKFVRLLQRELALKGEDQRKIERVEREEKVEKEVLLGERGEEGLEEWRACKESRRVTGMWRRDVMDVMQQMEELGVKVPGGRQTMMAEYL